MDIGGRLRTNQNRQDDVSLTSIQINCDSAANIFERFHPKEHEPSFTFYSIYTHRKIVSAIYSVNLWTKSKKMLMSCLSVDKSNELKQNELG